MLARWKDIELSIMKDPPIHALLACTNLDKLIKDTQNPWIKTQLKIWNKVKGEYQLNDKIQIIQWCAFDPGFRPNLTDNSFKSWISKGITTFYSLTENGKLRDFEGLKKEYHLENSDFFRYLQVRNYFEHSIKPKTDLNDPILKTILVAYKNASVKGVIVLQRYLGEKYPLHRLHKRKMGKGKQRVNIYS